CHPILPPPTRPARRRLEPVTDILDSYAVVAIYSAMAVYLVAFVFFTLDLAKRSEASVAAKAPVRAGLAAASVEHGVIATLERERTDAAPPPPAPRRLERVAF